MLDFQVPGRRKMLKEIDMKTNRWFLTKGGFSRVTGMREDQYTVDFVRDADVENFFDLFIESREVGIVVVKKNTPTKRKSVAKEHFLRKCVTLQHKENTVLVSLLDDFNM